MAIFAEVQLSRMWVGDVPVSPTHTDFFDENGDAVHITGFTSWTADLSGPDGIVIEALTGTVHGQHLDIAWPSVTLLETAGVYSLNITFFDTGGVELRVEPWAFVVQEVDGWLTLDRARLDWPDAPLDDVLLYRLLEAAKAQCVEYAPALQLGAVVPGRYVQAQAMQARALYQSVIANQNDSVGIEGFTVRVFPLDFTIRALLRPKRPVGGMF